MTVEPSWLRSGTLYAVRHGSHAYGTATPTSDVDIRGFCCPPPRYVHGWLHKFEQYEQKGDPDIVIYDVRKFFHLATDCNPNIIELLFVDDGDIITSSPEIRLILARRHEFLSRKARMTFAKYAVGQLKRIETHRQWLLAPPRAAPQRSEFGLPEHMVVPKAQLEALDAAIKREVESWDVDLDGTDQATRIAITCRLERALASINMATLEARYRLAAQHMGVHESLIQLAERERSFRAAQRRWEQYNVWLGSRNEARAELEMRVGYDAKNAMHLVRLMRMCREILQDGNVIVKRPDAAELLEIRRGAWSYEQLSAWASKQDAELDAICASSSLPEHPDREALDKLCALTVESALARMYT